MKTFDIPYNPITEDTFERQDWEMNVDSEVDTEGNATEYYYWTLPIPKDNPEKNSLQFISSCSDDYKELGIKEGEYFVEIEGLYGLGLCTNEEELEILYRALTKTELE